MAQAGARGLESLVVPQRQGWARVIGRRITPWGAVVVSAVVVLAVLVLLPLYYLVLESLKTPAGLSLANYAQIAQLTRFREAMLNSLILGLSCAFLGMAMGAPLAWLVSRTNLPLRGVVRVFVLGAFITPGFVNALAWTLLGGPNAGYLNKAWMALTGAERGFFDIYTLPGLILVSLATVYPLSFIFMYNAFEMMDSEIEEAARVLGAGTLRILFTITLPLARPAIIAGFILMFMESLILYGVPAVIGVPARVYVITTQLWSLFEYPPKIGLAAALSLPLLVITALLLWLQRRLVARGGYTTILGKGGRRHRVDLGVWKWPALAGAFLVILFTVILPMFVVVGTSLLDQVFRGISLDNLTLKNYWFVLFNFESGALSIRNSLVTSAIAATAGVLIAVVVAYLTERRIGRFGGVLSFLAMLPLVIPGMVFAVGLFSSYSKGPIVLYGTLWILALAYLTKFLPFAFISCGTAIASVYVELENAARVLGASRLRVLRDITGPLVKNGLLGGWILVFTPAVKELSSSVLLYNPKTTVIATAIMDAYLLPRWEAVAALSVLLLIINTTVILVGYRMIGGNVLGRTG